MTIDKPLQVQMPNLMTLRMILMMQARILRQLKAMSKTQLQIHRFQKMLLQIPKENLENLPPTSAKKENVAFCNHVIMNFSKMPVFQ